MENSAESSIVENEINPANMMESLMKSSFTEKEINSGDTMDISAESSVAEKETNAGDKMEISAESCIPEKDNDSSVSRCEHTTESESEEQLRVFVTLLTVRVLEKCNTLKSCREGLAVTEGFCPDIKDVKKVTKAVMKNLQKMFGSKWLLETGTSLEDPVVDTTII
ncbi:hypothetical protein D5F01_LYC01235 [Larimichthys crocea]|uniref:Uncharacterized protein n=1 Tax=Larimichthys crocea TaxID=215358 RepID=A0A6G0JC99_LARCR|nr:hypothetical protein D5F01_LYC01235 [Larimichthys crocea]